MGISLTPQPNRVRDAAASRRTWAATAVALVALATGALSLQNTFVWDDAAMIAEAAVRTPQGIRSIWFSPGAIGSEGHYWPLTWTSFWLDYRLHGEWAPGWHATNVVLHAAVSVLVGLTLARAGVRGAWLGAALFAVHPVNAEVIGWTIARKDSLAALLALGAAYRWLVDEERARASVWPTLLIGAALLAKSSAMAAVPAIAILQWWKSATLSPAHLARLAPMAALGAAMVGADAWRYAHIDTFSLGHDAPTRLGAAGWAVAAQVRALAWPWDSAPIAGPYEGGTVANATGLAMLAVTGLALAVLWRARTRIGPGPFAALAGFLVALAPTLGLVEFSFLRFSATADRYAYLAAIGPLALAGAGLAWAREHAALRAGAKARAAAAAALCAGLAALGATSAAHTGAYRDNVTFFTRVLETAPGDAAMTRNLMKALAEAQEHERAAQIATQALVRHPGDARTAHSAARALRAAGRAREAEAAYRRAIALRPERAMSHVGLGYTLLAQGRAREAAAAFENAGERSANVRGAIAATLARTRLQLGETRKAVAAYREGLALRPDDALLHANLGAVLAAYGAHEAALTHLERALGLDPGLEPARALRAQILESTEPAKRVK